MTDTAQAKERNEFRLDVRGAYLRRTNLSFASLVGANLSDADFTNAVLCGADFEAAILDGTILTGADLTGAKSLTIAQLKRAVVDDKTKLPDNISMKDL